MHNLNKKWQKQAKKHIKYKIVILKPTITQSPIKTNILLNNSKLQNHKQKNSNNFPFRLYC